MQHTCNTGKRRDKTRFTFRFQPLVFVFAFPNIRLMLFPLFKEFILEKANFSSFAPSPNVSIPMPRILPWDDTDINPLATDCACLVHSASFHSWMYSFKRRWPDLGDLSHFVIIFLSTYCVTSCEVVIGEKTVLIADWDSEQIAPFFNGALLIWTDLTEATEVPPVWQPALHGRQRPCLRSPVTHPGQPQIQTPSHAISVDTGTLVLYWVIFQPTVGWTILAGAHTSRG